MKVPGASIRTVFCSHAANVLFCKLGLKVAEYSPFAKANRERTIVFLSKLNVIVAKITLCEGAMRAQRIAHCRLNLRALKRTIS